MPSQDLIKLKHGAIVLWHITEDEECLAKLAVPDICPENIISPNKRLEWLTGRILIKLLASHCELPYKGIYKDEYGKPFLVGHSHHISLSHSHPYVAAQINSNFSVGIDIEQPKEKLLKIAPRVLSEEELSNAGADIVKHCVYWCAKEALYKVYGRRGLLFTSHLKIAPFNLSSEGNIKGTIEIAEVKIEVSLHYITKKDFVLVYSNIEQ